MLFPPLALTGIRHALESNAPLVIGDVADGAIALVLAELEGLRFGKGDDVPALVTYIARDGLRQAVTAASGCPAWYR